MVACIMGSDFLYAATIENGIVDSRARWCVNFPRSESQVALIEDQEKNVLGLHFRGV